VLDNGTYAGTYGGGAKFSNFEYLGSQIGNNDVNLMFKLNTLCGQYGVDVVDMGNVIAFAMECYENGILAKEDTNGLALRWGDHEAILKLMEMTMKREGIGNVLAEGAKRASEIIRKGSERFALHVKGLGFSTVDPRHGKGLALSYAVSSRGACHMNEPLNERCFVPYCRMPDGKAKLTVLSENRNALEDCLGICHMIFDIYFQDITAAAVSHLDTQAERLLNEYSVRISNLYNSITGEHVSGQDLLRIGERVVNLERAFNVREGITRKDDTLPTRFLKEPLNSGLGKGHVAKLDMILGEYYECRGWDSHTGFPLKSRLTELGLEKVADELETLDHIHR
jgi:aldehyde:ferredoxin oxidoreductase